MIDLFESFLISAVLVVLESEVCRSDGRLLVEAARGAAAKEFHRGGFDVLRGFLEDRRAIWSASTPGLLSPTEQESGRRR
jgi:hypothetical protein